MVEWRPHVLASVESTQDEVRLVAEKGEVEGYVIQAFQQKGGKGRSGNQWSSPMGNLYMSFLLRPNCGLDRAGELAFVIGLGLSSAFDDYIDADKHDKRLKWPNDVLIDGLKISGILLESVIEQNKLSGVIVGMGVNILNSPDLAICLNKVATDAVYVNKVRDNILDKVGKTYDLWQEQGFAPIRDMWLKQAYNLGEPITARLPSEKHKGIFKGINEEGSLLLEMSDGEVKIIHAADVHFGDVK